MAKTALVLAYHFPPIGGAGPERALHLARHLPEHGYAPIVLTGTGGFGFWSPEDPAAVERVPGDVPVLRVPTRPAPAWWQRVERLLALPTRFGRRFETGAVRAARELRGRVDVLLVELGPYDLGDTALRLARELGAPLVADLQDPWALDDVWLYPTGAHRVLDRRRMRRVLTGASAVIMNTEEAAGRVCAAFPEVPGGRVFAIPNGFGGDGVSRVAQSSPDAVRIVHTGSLHTELGLRHRRTARLRAALGGMPTPGVDLLPRSHVYLLEAVDRLLSRSPEAAGTIEVHLAGALTDADRDVAAGRPYVRLHGYLPHGETAELVAGADLLFLPMYDVPPGVRAALVPTKTYEYAASGRPILAAVPPGDARDLLGRLGTATIVDPTDVAGMERAIADRLAALRRGEAPPQADARVLERFEYREIVRRIAQVLDEVTAE